MLIFGGLPCLTKAVCSLSGIGVCRASHARFPAPRTRAGTQGTSVLCLGNGDLESNPVVTSYTWSNSSILNHPRTKKVPFLLDYGVLPACSGEMITAGSVWTAVLAAGGGRRSSQSDMSNAQESMSIRDIDCIRDLFREEQLLNVWSIIVDGIFQKCMATSESCLTLVRYHNPHLASSSSAFWRYCSSGFVGSQSCSSKYEAILTFFQKWVNFELLHRQKKIASWLATR